MPELPDSWWRRDSLLLSAISLGVLGAQIHFGISWTVGFDESWHVFLGSLKPLGRAFEGFFQDAHPPLSYLLMRPLLALGNETIWPRLLSIIPGAVQPWLVFSIARSSGASRPVAYVGAATLGVSHVFTEISVCVRAYSLATLFTLVSLRYLLDFLPGAGAPSRRAGILCLVSASLGVCTEYSVGLASAALVAAIVAVSAVDSRYRQLLIENVRTHTRWPEWTFFVTGHAVSIVYLLKTFAGQPLNHVFLYYPAAGESTLDYAWKGTLANLAVLTPLDVRGSGLALPVVAGLATLLVVFVWQGIRRSATPRARTLAALVVVPALLWAGLFVLGVMRVYPFGGPPRHQYLLFPWLLVAYVVALDALYRRLSSPVLRAGLCSVAMVLAVVTSIRSVESRLVVCEFPLENLFAQEAPEIFTPTNTETPIYLSRFSTYGLFAHQRFRGWELAKPRNQQFDEFLVGSTPNLHRVFFDNATWTNDALPTEAFFHRVRVLAEVADSDSVRAHLARPQPGSIEERRALSEELESLCLRHGFRLVAHDVYRESEVLFLERTTGAPGPS